MATVIKVKSKERVAAIEAAEKAGARTLAGGLNLPEGTHSFLVADAKEAFGLLNVDSKASGKWALPIVAGTMTVAGSGEKIAFEISEKPGAKTLVIPNSFFTEMQPNAVYGITVETRNGRKVVTNVAVGEAVSTEDDD